MVCVLPGRASICPLPLLSIQYTDMPTYHHGLCAAGEGQYLPAATVEYLGGAAARLAHHADRLHSLLVGQTHHNLKRTKINTRNTTVLSDIITVVNISDVNSNESMNHFCRYGTHIMNMKFAQFFVIFSRVRSGTVRNNIKF